MDNPLLKVRVRFTLLQLTLNPTAFPLVRDDFSRRDVNDLTAVLTYRYFVYAAVCFPSRTLSVQFVLSGSGRGREQEQILPSAPSGRLVWPRSLPARRHLP